MRVLVFFVGYMAGSLFGVVMMCLLQAGRLHEWKEENDVSGNPQRNKGEK